MNPNTIITLSNRINPDGSLKADVRRRVDKGIELFECGTSGYLTMSGGDTDMSTLTQAESMKRYAMRHHVPEDAILKEEKSFGTVQQAYFTKADIMKPREWQRAVVVSSEYHIPRVKDIFDIIYGEDYDMIFRGVQSIDKNIYKEEQKKKFKDLRLLEGLKRGDDDSIRRRLMKYDHHYNRRKWSARDRIEKAVSLSIGTI